MTRRFVRDVGLLLLFAVLWLGWQAYQSRQCSTRCAAGGYAADYAAYPVNECRCVDDSGVLMVPP